MVDWYFSENTSPSDELVDNFADSKFSIDKWNSFTREIIQNSMDAVDDESKPVKVVFDLNKELSLKDIPGGYYTKEVLEKCYNISTNRQTKNSYKKGLEILGKDKVYCLKISDYNTKGVKTGRDEAWGALVFDEGKSIKQRPGSAGSHGVGKKVPFIISNVNTVFYATKNKYVDDTGCERSDCLVQGKTTLIDWTDNEGIRRNSKGWYGEISNDKSDSKNRITPLINEKIEHINDYFVRREKYGTDVVIVAVKAYENEEELRKQMINAIMNNFFVAIFENKLELDVLGEKVNAETFSSIYSKYYENYDKTTKISLKSSLKAYKGDKKVIYIDDDKGNILGNVEIYFTLECDNKRKYYSIFRNHGMKIKEKALRKPDQYYTAVVIIRGEMLNKLLSTLENAAHDDFITVDETMEIDADAKKAYLKVEEVVRDYIIEKAKIEVDSEQELEGVENIITIPGQLSAIKNAEKKAKIKRKPISTKGKGMKSENHSEGSGGKSIGKGDKKNKKGTGGSIRPTGRIKGIIYSDYGVKPFFVNEGKKYKGKLSVKENLKNATIVFHSVNADGNADDTLSDIISSVKIGRRRFEGKNIVAGKIRNVSLHKDNLYDIEIEVSKDCVYQIVSEIIVGKGDK